MAPQIEGNGLELWRRVFSEYEGCDDLVKMAGRLKLLEFPQIKSDKHINHQLDEWLDPV